MKRLRLLFAGLMMASAARALWAGESGVTVAGHGSRSYDVEGAFEVQAPSAAVWEVLTDYEGLPNFVTGMRASRVAERRPDGTLVLEQEGAAEAWLFSRAIHLRLNVSRAGDRLCFEDGLHRDFRSYAGGWEVRAEGDRVQVSYRLRAEPNFPIPSFLLRHKLKRTARSLLEQVRSEILRRAVLADLYRR